MSLQRPLRMPRRPRRFQPAILAALLAATGCYTSHTGPVDGDLEDGRTRDDATFPPDTPDAGGARFVPDTDSPAPGTVWLRAESVSTAELTLLVLVRADEPVFGVAGRLRYNPSVLHLREAGSCGAFDIAGPAVFDSLERPTGDGEGTPVETWFGVASASHEVLVDARTEACAVRAAFTVLGPGSTRVDLLPGRSGAVGAPPTRLVTSAVAGGRLEVTP